MPTIRYTDAEGVIVKTEEFARREDADNAYDKAVMGFDHDQGPKGAEYVEYVDGAVVKRDQRTHRTKHGDPIPPEGFSDEHPDPAQTSKSAKDDRNAEGAADAAADHGDAKSAAEAEADLLADNPKERIAAKERALSVPGADAKSVAKAEAKPDADAPSTPKERQAAQERELSATQTPPKPPAKPVSRKSKT